MPEQAAALNRQPADFAVSLLGHETQELMSTGGQCLANGDAETAESLFRAAAIKRPWDPETRYQFASAQIAAGHADEALRTLAEARDLHARLILQANAPEAMAVDADPQRLLELANLFYGKNHMATATSLFQRLVDANPDIPNLRLQLGLTLQHQGRVEEAIAVFESLVRRWPHPTHHSFLHYAIAFQRATPAAMYEEGLRYAQMHTAHLPKRKRSLTRRDGKLRVGYFSPLFNQHQLTKFFAPVMEHHDRSRFSLVCYSGAPVSDAVGAAIREGCDLWREVGQMDDEAFASQVAADEIDILVDLWGHTAGNRLPVFARRPAPINLSWLNYIETTGLAEFDYVLHANAYDLPGAQELYSEPIYPIGPVVAPFRQFFDMPPAGDTPMLVNKHMTFGCFGHPAKLTLKVIETWSEILKAVPTSKLVLRSGYYDDPTLQRTIRAQFAAFGVAATRIEFPPFETGAAYLSTYRKVDLIFDPFPYQGLTTTLDAVSAGIPVLTWEGKHMHDRIATVTLQACGLEELCAPTREAYVETAIALAKDPARLNALRARVRPGFEDSAYRDEAGFTRRLEAAFEAMAEAKDGKRLPPRSENPPKPAAAIAKPAAASPPILPFVTEAEYAQAVSAPQEVLYEAERVEGGRPIMFPEPESNFFDLRPLGYDFPAVTLTTLRDVVVRGKSNFLTPPDAILRHQFFNPVSEIATEEFYGRLEFSADHRDARWIESGAFDAGCLPEAAVFTDGVAFNYAHWMTEVLPRIAAFVRGGAHAGVPLIVDSDLHPNIVRSITLVAGPDAVVYSLRPDQFVKVGVLHSVSPTGYIAFKNRPQPQETIGQGIFAPRALRQAIEHLRRAAELGPADKARPKLFLRRKSGARHIVNEAEIQEALVARGFVVVEPERLSLDDQMALYSGAGMIVGATGAAITNLLFCQPDCPTVVMIPKFQQTAYWYWRGMAAAAGTGPVLHVTGEQINPAADPFDPLALHANFAVELKDVLDAVDVAKTISG